ncbi:hypothetical protein RMATCC62417_00847 [Rhizopus microsporus]|nr:hypothetical protein RMATCC62417_00847 [Rhizopus microsporus]
MDKSIKSSPMMNDLNTCFSEEEESDSTNSTNSLENNHKRFNKAVLKKREVKLNKKDELDSDNDSLIEYSKNTKKIKNTKKQQSSETEKKQKSLYKTELCRNWEETGQCRYGLKCQYAHGAQDLREIERHPKYKTQKCRTFHKTGACPYGSRCTFRHFSLPGDDAKIKEENDKMGSVTGTSATTTTSTLSTTVFRGTESSKREPMVFPSAFTENLKMFQPNQWYNDASFPFATTATTIPPTLGDQPLKRNYSPFVDYEDSLLPSNAESLLPHQLLFDLDSPDVEEQMKHCPLRNYVSQIPSYQHTTINTTNTNDTLCKSFFRPWLI